MTVSYWKASENPENVLSVYSQGWFICLSTPNSRKICNAEKIYIVAKKGKKKKKETCQDLLLNFLWHKYNVKGVLLLPQSLLFRSTLNLQQYHDILLFCHK